MLYNLIEKYSGWLEEVGPYTLLQVVFQIEFRAFTSLLLSFFLVLFCGNQVIRWLASKKIGDNPEFHHRDLNELMSDRKGIPTMGGILICGAVLTVTLLFSDMTNRYVHIGILVLVWLALLGGIDDWLKLTASQRSPGSRDGLYPKEKFLFQCGLGFLVGWFLWSMGSDYPEARSLTLPFQRTYSPGSEGENIEQGVIVLGLGFFTFISILMIGGMSNAVNITDGMDGLAAGLVTIASLGLMVLTFIAGRFETAVDLMFPYVEGTIELTVFLGGMAGSCLGFLWFNCRPAKVFMGDIGSLPLGGLLAFISIAIRQEILLLVICGVFIVNITSVVFQVAYYKWSGGQKIFRCSPIHHHFHLGGWSEQQTVTRFYIVGIVFAIIALVSLKLR